VSEDHGERFHKDVEDMQKRQYGEGGGLIRRDESSHKRRDNQF
jgi:hypothetical protein